jgi:hypothetical protein
LSMRSPTMSAAAGAARRSGSGRSYAATPPRPSRRTRPSRRDHPYSSCRRWFGGSPTRRSAPRGRGRGSIRPRRPPPCRSTRLGRPAPSCRDSSVVLTRADLLDILEEALNGLPGVEDLSLRGPRLIVVSRTHRAHEPLFELSDRRRKPLSAHLLIVPAPSSTSPANGRPDSPITQGRAMQSAVRLPARSSTARPA